MDQNNQPSQPKDIYQASSNGTPPTPPQQPSEQPDSQVPVYATKPPAYPANVQPPAPAQQPPQPPVPNYHQSHQLPPEPEQNQTEPVSPVTEPAPTTQMTPQTPPTPQPMTPQNQPVAQSPQISQSPQPTQTTPPPVPPYTPPQETTAPSESQPPRPKSRVGLLLVIAVILLSVIAAVGFYLWTQSQGNNDFFSLPRLNPTQNPPTPTPALSDTTNQQPDSIPSASESGHSDPIGTTGWLVYTEDVHNFEISYPDTFEVSGSLATSLSNWTAGRGLSISNPNDPAQPEIFIETIYDGYGPFFPTGDIVADFVNDRLVVNQIDTSSYDYDGQVKSGLIDEGSDLFMTETLEYDGTVYRFQIKHQDHGNQKLNQDLLDILSTFKFIDADSSQTSPTTQKGGRDWLTYTNTESDYEISYPTDHKVIAMAAGSSGQLATPNSVMVEIQEKASDSLRITIQPLSGNPDFNGKATSEKKLGDNFFQYTETVTETNQTARTYVVDYPGDEYLEFQVNVDSSDQFELVEEILSTLMLK